VNERKTLGRKIVANKVKLMGDNYGKIGTRILLSKLIRGRLSIDRQSLLFLTSSIGLRGKNQSIHECLHVARQRD
jgi:hypothetical protein